MGTKRSKPSAAAKYVVDYTSERPTVSFVAYADDISPLELSDVYANPVSVSYSFDPWPSGGAELITECIGLMAQGIFNMQTRGDEMMQADAATWAKVRRLIDPVVVQWA